VSLSIQVAARVCVSVFWFCVTYAHASAAGSEGASISTHPDNAIDPQHLFDKHCADCHDGSVPKAPHQILFQIMGSQAIADAMADGVMKAQASMLEAEEQRALAVFLGGAELDNAPVKRCEYDKLANAKPQLSGWSLNAEGTRFVPASVAQLRASEVPKLRLKWVFAYPGATRARSQPVPYGDALLLGSQSGAVYALERDRGCVVWMFQADHEVRNALAVSDDGNTAYFGDTRGGVYAIDPMTGTELWRAQAAAHPDVTLTGSPRLVKDTLYVPLSSNEWASAADPGYGCCTFRGGVAAFNTKDGKHLWTAYSIDQVPQARGRKNDRGAELFHPAGAPIWNTPSVDLQRNLLLVGTGEAYTSPAANTSDSILAIDLTTGQRRWAYQSTSGDAWNMACFIGGGPNCPAEDGPDLDIGAPPMVIRRGPNDLIIGGQKSGHVFALQADDGQLVWRRKVGRGGFAGGVHWGMASAGEKIFVPIADTTFTGRFVGEPKPGLSALSVEDGRVLWFAPAPDTCTPASKPACDPGFSAAVTATDEVVFAGAFDGYLRAYATQDGRLLWEFDTNREFASVSGVMAHGGSIESDGPVIVDGQVIINSGYLYGGRMPGNALLVFSAE